MTYEARLLVNYAYGTLSTAADSSETTLNSAEFSTRIPTGLSTSLYVPITLHDPDLGLHEMVWATAHAAGATMVTCVRGREGTAGRTWPMGTKWTVSLGARDATMAATSVSTLPSDPHIGMRVYLDNNKGVMERYANSWGPPSVFLRQASGLNQQIPTGVWNPIIFNAEDWDSAFGFTSSTEYTIKVAGRYQLSAAVAFDPNTVGVRGVGFRKNGTILPSSLNMANALAPAGFIQVLQSSIVEAAFAVNDKIEVIAWQNSGTYLQLPTAYSEYQTHLLIQWVEV